MKLVSFAGSIILVIGLLSSANIANANPIAWCVQNPVKCKEIAKKIEEVFNTQTGKCLKYTGDCNKGNYSTKFIRVCEDMFRRVKLFKDQPTDVGFQSIWKAAGSSRAACVAQRAMGCDQWKYVLEQYGLKGDWRYKCSSW